MTLFLLEDDFCPVDLLTNFLPEAEEMVAVQTLSLVGLSLPCGCHYDWMNYFFLEDLPSKSAYQAEWRKHETVLPVPSMQECICCYTSRVWFQCNVSKKLVAECGCKQIQIWLFHKCCNILENWNIYFPFWIVLDVSWLPVCMYIQSTGKVLFRYCNLFPEKVTPNWLADMQKFSVVFTLHF